MKGGILAALLCSVWATLLYSNSLHGDFVFDDTAAIKENKDLLPASPWSNLLVHDFWGDDLHHLKSHKSFRPITSATFKINYHLHQKDTRPYHLVNVILNAIVSFLFTWLAYSLFDDKVWPALLSGLLYTAHPLHTEAVASVVGRAELLSSLFFLLALLAYKRAAQSTKVGWKWLILSMALAVCSMLSKEQGITVVAVCLLYEAFIILKLNLQDGWHLIHRAIIRPSKLSKAHKLFITRAIVIFIFLVVTFGCRVMIMYGGPTFSRADNPGQGLKNPVRQLYYLHLIFVNIWIFLCPSKLRHDWRFGPIPLFTSASDSRNIFTAITFASLIILGSMVMRRKGDYARIVSFSLSFSIITFLPSSNLFILIGFVVAERVLYLPTMGACLLVGFAVWNILKHRNTTELARMITKCAITCLIAIYSIKTVHRNYAWRSAYNLYVEALKLYPSDGLMFSNLGLELNQSNLVEHCNVLAVTHAPNFSQPFRNYGSFLERHQRFDEAEKMYRQAISILGAVPRSKRSRRVQTYQALARIISRNESRIHEAVSLMNVSIQLEPDEERSYKLQADMLIRLNETQRVIPMFEKALKQFPSNLDLMYIAAEACFSMGNDCAEVYYLKIISLDRRHGMAKVNYANIIAEKDTATLDDLITAYKYLQVVITARENYTDYYNLALINLRLNRSEHAQEKFKHVLSLNPTHSSSLKHLGQIHYSKKNYSAASDVLELLSSSGELYHKENTAYLNWLGQSYLELHLQTKAEELYRRVLEQDPEHSGAMIALGKIHMISKKYREAEKLFSRAYALNSTAKQVKIMMDKAKLLQEK